MKKYLLSMLFVLALMIGIVSNTILVNATETSTFPSGEYGTFTDGGQVISDLIEKCGEKVHPRIIMSEKKFEDLRSHIGDGSVTAILLEELRGEAERHLGEPVSEYDAYGDDHLLETSKRIQRRVAALALAYNIFGKEDYAKRCYAELEAACKFPDWSPKHFLDTAEMCTAFAYGYDWLYNWMTPEKRKTLRDAMIEKGLNQVMEDYNDTPGRKRTYKWYQDLEGDNWQLVCTGGTDLVALAIGDEKEAKDIAAKALTHGYQRAYSFVRRAYNTTDGTYIEGLGYWDYATYYLGLQSSALISATGTDYGLADYAGIQKSAEFVRYMSSNVPKSFSFGDDRESRDTGWAVFLWLGEHLNSPELSAVRLRKIDVDPEFNYLDVLWIDESKQADPVNNNATDWGVVGASNASFRDTWEQDGLVTALHVGENRYKYHGHYDLGSFYIESNGARFFTDLGNESYSLENRQFSYRIKAEGHNTLVINPTEDIDQREGANCVITEFRSGNEAYAVTDLTDAYGPSGASSVIRGLKMIKDKKCIVVQDEISLQAPGEIYWFAHTKGEIAVGTDGRSAIVTVGDERLWVGLLSAAGKFTVMDAKPLDTSRKIPNATNNDEYRKLAIHLTNTKDTTISVVCIPLNSGEKKPAWLPTMKAISEWSREDENVINITLQPSSQTVELGNRAEFTVVAEGSGLTYQWKYSMDNGTTWKVPTATCAKTKTFSITAADKWNGMRLFCRVTNEKGKSVTTKVVRLTVNTPVLEITTQPTDAAVEIGAKANFKVAATGSGHTYQWKYSMDNGTTWKVPTATSAKTDTFSITAAEKWNGMKLFCRVTDAKGQSVTTKVVRLNVKTAVPVIINQPANVSVASGVKATFKVVATGTDISYQWYYSMDKGTTWKVSTATSAATDTFSIAAAAKWNGMMLKCIVTDGKGQKVTSNAASLTVK